MPTASDTLLSLPVIKGWEDVWQLALVAGVLMLIASTGRVWWLILAAGGIHFMTFFMKDVTLRNIEQQLGRKVKTVWDDTNAGNPLAITEVVFGCIAAPLLLTFLIMLIVGVETQLLVGFGLICMIFVLLTCFIDRLSENFKLTSTITSLETKADEGTRALEGAFDESKDEVKFDEDWHSPPPKPTIVAELLESASWHENEDANADDVNEEEEEVEHAQDEVDHVK